MTVDGLIGDLSLHLVSGAYTSGHAHVDPGGNTGIQAWRTDDRQCEDTRIDWLQAGHVYTVTLTDSPGCSGGRVRPQIAFKES
jgi:hypothetical protein